MPNPTDHEKVGPGKKNGRRLQVYSLQQDENSSQAVEQRNPVTYHHSKKSWKG
jgi:hypothetical protein